jgi:hypothetical protein
MRMTLRNRIAVELATSGAEANEVWLWEKRE